MGINEQIKTAATKAEVTRLASTLQPMASQKTLRRRKRLVKQRLSEK